MNKRQTKKQKNKVVIPFFMMDEMHLISMTEEERKVFYKARKEFIERYCRYKHYKDKDHIKIDRKKWLDSVCMVPTAGESYFENLCKHVRKREIAVTIVPDDLLETVHN